MSKLISGKEWLGKDAELSKRRVVQALKFIFLLCLFFGLFWIIPLADVFQVIKSANPLLLIIGLGLGLPNIYLKSVRLGLLTRKQGLPISFNRLFVVNLMVKFYLLVLPGTLIGSGIRWAKISPSGKSAESLAAVAFNRFIETFLIIITGIFWFIAGIGQETINWVILLAFFLSIIIIWFLFIKVSIYLAQWFESKPEIITGHARWQFIWDYLKRTVKSLSVYAGLSIRELFNLIGVGLLAYLVGLISYIFIARSTDIDISIYNLGWTQSAILLAALAPIAIAGGLGIREVSLVVMLGLYGVEAEVALAFSILLFARNIFLSLIGGILELREIIQKRKAI